MKWTVAVAVVVTAAAILFWQGDLMAKGQYKRGHRVYETRCEVCHGVNGDGKGPAAAHYDPRPTNFGDPKFWQRKDIDQFITKTIQEGHGTMPAIDLKPYELRGVISYLSHTFRPQGM